MRPIPPALTLAVLSWSPCAWPCTQAFTLGETRPREQEVYPSNGQLWLSFSGPSDALVGLIRGPDLADTALELTRVGPDLVTARLPPLTVGSTYELELTSPAQGLAKQVRFVAGADPDPRPPEPLDWAASFTVRTDLPCASVGVYARAEIPPAARQPVAWRLLDAATDQPLGTLVPGAAEEAPYVLERFVAAQAPVCLRLAALGVDGTTTTSPQVHCYPPHVLDAGISDSGGEDDAGLPLPDDAGLPGPDAGAMPADAGPPAGLASSQDGCGCSAMPVAGAWSDVLAVALLLGLAARRRRPRRTQRSWRRK